MTIQDFATHHRLKARIDPEDGTDIIPGHEGHSHIYQYDDDLLAVMVMPETGTAHWWKLASSAFKSAGMVIRQDADEEGTATFDPADSAQVKLAMKYARVRPKRQLSAGHKTKLVDAAARYRASDPILQGDLTA